MESELEDIAQITGALNYADVHAIMTAIGTDATLKKKIRGLVSDWKAACEVEDGGEMNRIGKAVKDLVPKKAESADDWDGWEEADGLSEVLDKIDELAYELNNCTRGARTRRKTWGDLADYVVGLGEALAEAGEGLRDRADESKKKNPGKKFSSAVEDEGGRKLSH